jgi:uncharacterized protein
VRKYNQIVDRESAYEILTGKIMEAQEAAPAQASSRGTAPKRAEKEEPSMMETIVKDPMARQIGRTVARELTRGLLGVLGLGGSSSRSRKKSWF